MEPVAFEIFGISIRWYGILISLGLLLGAILAIKECKRIGFNEEKLIDLLLFAVPAAIIGARLYYVIFSWEYYRWDFMKIINIRGGGLAIHGGIIASVLTAIIFCKIKKIDFWLIADITAPSIILGQAIGRWGNFINKEAYGTPTDLPWAILVDGQRVHPTFLYESLWNLLIFFFLIWYRKNKKQFNGEVFLLYLSLYSVGRFFIEGLRIDSLMLGPLRVAQVISLIIILLSTAIFIYKKRVKSL
ncbi:prolipoprotein diacylglyceryl transferase [Clostridiisalibacter paucivorans]|uniref:prolipoprotein diacylglyceryl transferase n=1 Tax=Clostridiisalibacter paucivorans TaxID=408753 RepID=UPI00047D48E8|nr:prolipoprotein diacylglyceryl transferase [Clostridiisalibacter paucivorans]